MKKEFTITLNITVETDVDFERVEEYAEQLAEDIKDEFEVRSDIEITEIMVHSVDGDRDEDNLFDHDDDE